MIKITQATLAKIDKIAVDGLDSSAKMADIRGAKVAALVEREDHGADQKAETQRLQLQLASVKKEWGDAAAKADMLEKQLESADSSVDTLREKLATAKTLADSRNNIIRAFKQIVDEVGF